MVFDLLYVKAFFYSYKAIIAVINSLSSKKFKDKTIILLEIELIYLKNILSIILIFVKVTTKL